MMRRPRKHMNKQTKLDAALHCLGLLGVEIQWDHQPPLALRDKIFDVDGEFLRYEPDENDPRYIVPMVTGLHREKTNGKRHDASNGDTHKIAKAKRLSEANEEFRARLTNPPAREDRPKRKWPSRKFARKGRNHAE